jgi:hypothetical protein
MMRARGHYYQLYTRQFRHELEVEYDPLRVASPAAA